MLSLGTVPPGLSRPTQQHPIVPRASSHHLLSTSKPPRPALPPSGEPPVAPSAVFPHLAPMLLPTTLGCARRATQLCTYIRLHVHPPTYSANRAAYASQRRGQTPDLPSCSCSPSMVLRISRCATHTPLEPSQRCSAASPPSAMAVLGGFSGGCASGRSVGHNRHSIAIPSPRPR